MSTTALQQEIIDVEEREMEDEASQREEEEEKEEDEALEELGSAIDETGEAAFEIPSVLLHNLPLIALVVGTGVGLIVLRWVVMISCPEIARHAKTYAFVINFLFGAVKSFMDLITIKNVINVAGFALDTQGGVGSAVDLAVETATVAVPYALGIAHWTNLFSRTTWDMFSTADVQEFFSRLPAECAAFDDIEHVLLFPVRAVASPTVCPVVRFTWPVPWLYSASTSVLGWMIFDADPMGNNCVSQDTDPYAWVCVGLGMGYVIIDVVLPLLLFMLFGYRCVDDNEPVHQQNINSNRDPPRSVVRSLTRLRLHRFVFPLIRTVVALVRWAMSETEDRLRAGGEAIDDVVQVTKALATEAASDVQLSMGSYI